MNSVEICHVDTTYFHEKLDSNEFPFEENRYWIFSSKLCPFAHRVEIVRKLLGLVEDIGLTIASSVQTEKGWNLSTPYKSIDSSVSPVDGIGRLPGIYEISVSNYNGRASVPVLFDTKTKSIVNNESAEIVLQLNDIAHRYYGHTSIYPEEKRELIDTLINDLKNDFISPIYRAGFALDQHTYDTNFDHVFAYLYKLNKHLDKYGPYLTGDELTLADVHAFPHLARFDSAYHSLYRLNFKYICDYPNIANFMSRMGEHPAFADTLDVKELKKGYFLSWNQPTNGLFVPEGPTVHPCTGIAINVKSKAGMQA